MIGSCQRLCLILGLLASMHVLEDVPRCMPPIFYAQQIIFAIDFMID